MSRTIQSLKSIRRVAEALTAEKYVIADSETR